MEEVLKALQKIQKELDEQKITIQKSGENVADQVTQKMNIIYDEKIKTLEEKYVNLKDKVDNQEKRLYFLEKQARQRNIVLFGLKETESSYSNVENIIINFINEHFSIKVDQRDIQEAKRIIKKRDKAKTNNYHSFNTWYKTSHIQTEEKNITTSTNLNADHKTQVSKKNKTGTSVRRSSSLPEGPIKPGILNFFQKHPTNTTKNPGKQK
nr:uncharacterized protein LOC116773399 [Danaus plexippus plexippus]